MSPRWRALVCLLLGVLSASAPRAEERATFDVRAAGMERDEALYLESLFELTDRVAAENAAVARWLLAERRHGLHFADYRVRVAALLVELDRLQSPRRVAELAPLLRGAVEAQRDFFGDWHRALEQGRSFESQATSEYGYHEGLHRSHRALLRTFERLLALFPDVDAWNRRAFFDHLGRLDLLGSGLGR